MNRSTPGLPVHHKLPEFTQTHVHSVGDAIQSTSYEMPGWMKHKLESKLLGEISVTSDMQVTPHLWQKRRTKEPLDESERGE